MSKRTTLLCAAVIAIVVPTARPVFAASRSGTQNALEMQHSQMMLPQSQQLAEPKRTRSLEAVKPPRSGDFYEGNTKEAEYEHVLDQEIATLYKLSVQNKRSPNRGEIWLRLGEEYVEKARLLDLREQANYERKLKDFADKRTRIRPQLNQRPAREYNEKAVQLYEWFVKDFPHDPKVDQALFFLGYNQFELGHTQLGERYYTELVEHYPNSVFITESQFALGEYYFENEAWAKALKNYAEVVKVKRARLNTFALYKSAWCLYRLNRTKVALQALERVIRQSRAGEGSDGGSGPHRTVNKVRLAQEALKDYVPFYAEAGTAEAAPGEFQRLAGNEKQAHDMLERLAYIYADNGNREAAKATFHHLIAENPTAEKAAEYQYQIVLANASRDQKEFRRELEVWLENFGPDSSWAQQNAKNKQLVADMSKLQETTLRNWVLQQHQAAQNSHAAFSQNAANAGYVQYTKHFPNSPKSVEMQFFHAELLFDMNHYEEAAQIYTWVAEKDPKGPYREKAIVNALLALEKNLPSDKQIEEKRGKSLDPIPFDPPVALFEKAAKRYIQAFPHGEKVGDIKRRLGVLYYSYNHFDEAIEQFSQVLKEQPKSQNAEIAGNLILDIYKLKNDMTGLTQRGHEFLANPDIANTKFGQQVRTMMEKAGYLSAEKTAKDGDALKAAKEFETFAAANGNSELGQAARFKAAANYEKGGDLVSAIRMHQAVIATPSEDPKIKSAQNDSKIALSRLYQQTGQLEQAAKEYQSYAASNPKDQKAINAYYNAGVLYDAMGMTGEAMHDYQQYLDQSNRSDKVEVIFAQAEMHKRQNEIAKAKTYYDRYLQAGPKNQAHAIQATFEIAEYYAAIGGVTKAKQGRQRVLEMYKTSGQQTREATVKYAAQVRFELAQEALHALLAIKFTANEKQQGRAAGEVKVAREKYIAEMKDVVRFDYGPMIVAALASTGQMFDSVARMFYSVPTPTGYSATEAAQYKQLLQQQVNGQMTEAKNSYKAAVDKSHEIESFTKWTKIAQQGLAADEAALGGANATDTVRDAGEITSDSRATDGMGL